MPRFLVSAAHRETGEVVSLAVDADTRQIAGEWAVEHGYLVHDITVDVPPEPPQQEHRPRAGRPLPHAGADAIERYLEGSARIIMTVVWVFESLYFGFFLWLLLVWSHAIWMACKLASRGSSTSSTNAYEPLTQPPVPRPAPQWQTPAQAVPDTPVGVDDAAMWTLQAVMLLVMVIGWWLITPLTVYALGRFGAAVLRGMADQLRLAKRACGLPYSKAIQGAEV
jgi:hypothetical protein